MKTYTFTRTVTDELPISRKLKKVYKVEAETLWDARTMVADMIDEIMYTCDRSAANPYDLMVSWDTRPRFRNIIYTITEE